MSDSRLEQMEAMFKQVQTLSLTKGNYQKGLAITRKVARLADEIAASAPNSRDHVSALMLHFYSVLWFSAMSRKNEASLRTQAYNICEEAVVIQLEGPPDQTVAHACYNLGIDLCEREKQTAKALLYLKTARTIARHLPEDQNPIEFGWRVTYGIAKCESDRGDPEEACRVLRRVLANRRPNLNRWIELRSFAKCAELLAKSILDCRERAAQK